MVHVKWNTWNVLSGKFNRIVLAHVAAAVALAYVFGAFDGTEVINK